MAVSKHIHFEELISITSCNNIFFYFLRKNNALFNFDSVCTRCGHGLCYFVLFSFVILIFILSGLITKKCITSIAPIQRQVSLPSVCNTWAGSYVDRGHRYDIFSSSTTPYFRQWPSPYRRYKQNTKLAECHIPYTVSSADIFTVQHVYERRQITFSTDSARKPPDGWSAQRDRHWSHLWQ